MGNEKKEKETPDMQIAKRLSDADKANRATFDKVVEAYTTKGGSIGTTKNVIVDHYTTRK